MAVDVETKPTLRAGRPQVLLESDFLGYDVTPDGKRYLMVKADPEESRPTHVKVVLNWFEELKRRDPGRSEVRLAAGSEISPLTR